MRYPVVHNKALGCGGMIGPPVTRQAEATQEFEEKEPDGRLGAAEVELMRARNFVGRLLQERAALSGILGEEKAKLAVQQAMDNLRHAENQVRTLGGKL